MKWTGVTPLLVLIAHFDVALATVEGPVVIQQPIFTHDGWIEICPVTYATRGDVWSTPGCLVARTLSENRIGTEGGFENRNAANLAGLRLELVEHSEPTPKGEHLYRGLFGDTLKVVLKVTDEALMSPVHPGDVLPHTRDCLLLNAQLEGRRFQFLDLRINGIDGFAEIEGVYSVSEKRKVAP